MSIIIPAFQFEIRYNHILNFSQIARKILAPYVKLTQSIKVENQNTLEERMILNFEEEDYFIIASWDRLLIKGQGNIDNFTTKNSSFQIPFLDIFDKIKGLEEFGSIQNVLFAINYIKKLDVEKEQLTSIFIDKSIMKNTADVLAEANDIAITLEDRSLDKQTSVSFGPYFGTSELLRRPIAPININNLGDTDFVGVMLEYKHVNRTSDVSFDNFVAMTKSSGKIFEKVWKTL